MESIDIGDLAPKFESSPRADNGKQTEGAAEGQVLPQADAELSLEPRMTGEPPGYQHGACSVSQFLPCGSGPLVSLCLGFLICKMDIISIATSWRITLIEITEA